MTDVTQDLAPFFELPELSTEAVTAFADRVHESHATWEKFAGLLSERSAAGDDPLKLAVAALLLGRFSAALEWFDKASDSKHAQFWRAKAAAALGRLEEARSALQAAAKQGWDAFECDMRIAVLHTREGEIAAAQKLAEKHMRVGEDRADWYYVRGLICEAEDDRMQAAELLQKAITLQPEHEQALFRLAWLHDMAGDDDAAIALYERLALRPRACVNALMNIAVIYEDCGKFNEAVQCLRRVLRVNPNHTRARLFLKDVESSREMIIDEQADEQLDARSRLLDAPISEFELSVRARNCLKKMNINTLGQLIQLTEAELLAYKNFGEASLNEIKQLLARKGVRLGQRPDEIDPNALAAEEGTPRVVVPPGREAVLNKTVTELELSVRSRRCLQRLNIVSLGDLIQHSEASLLATRNFGQTSLTELKARLAELGLTLAPKQAE